MLVFFIYFEELATAAYFSTTMKNNKFFQSFKEPARGEFVSHIFLSKGGK